jgi:tRNA pseudouridine38-40 synthase
MVRNIIGTAVNVGTGKLSIEQFGRIFEGRDRKRAGATAPSCGLYLVDVFYENSAIILDNTDNIK